MPLMEDEEHLSTLIKKRISRFQSKSSEMSKVSRFQILFNKLLASKAILKKWGILYCLYNVSEDSSGPSAMSSLVQKTMGGTILTKVEAPEPMVINKKEEHKEKKVNVFGNVGEEEILRDLLYVFQEIDGKYISYSLLDDTYTISSSVVIAESTKEIVLELCELGWLYRKVIDYVHKHSDNIYAGQVVQSFCFAIQGELNEYFRLLAVLEQQLLNIGQADNKLNLMKLYLWTQEPMEKIKWLAAICDTTQSICLVE
jgi:gamma-tubulin complex component 3